MMDSEDIQRLEILQTSWLALAAKATLLTKLEPRLTQKFHYDTTIRTIVVGAFSLKSAASEVLLLLILSLNI